MEFNQEAPHPGGAGRRLWLVPLGNITRVLVSPNSMPMRKSVITINLSAIRTINLPAITCPLSERLILGGIIGLAPAAGQIATEKLPGWRKNG